jgi:hypothetical protein
VAEHPALPAPTSAKIKNTSYLFQACYGLLESYLHSLLCIKVSENPKNYCTRMTLPKLAKTHFGADCPLGVKLPIEFPIFSSSFFGTRESKIELIHYEK